MPRIKCHYVDCVFIDEGICSAAAVEVDPDEGCKTYSPAEETAATDDEWDEDDETEWEDDDSEDDDEWVDEEDEF
jgi:hypothetical protein